MNHYRQAVLRSLDTIEQGLRRPLALHALARRAGFSLWHFHRIFAEHTGESLGSYLRKRRLTAAAGELARSDRSVLDVALDYQFESHEAFTRAFKAAFDATPSEFRRTGKLAWLRTRPEITPARLHALPTQTTMKPRIVSLPALNLLGLSARFVPPLSPAADNLDVVPKLYERFCPLIPGLPAMLDQYIYGAARYPTDRAGANPDEREYLASINVAAGTKPKKPLVLWSIPAGTYACFTHRGPIARFGETIHYVFGTWLPRSKFIHGDGPNLDRQDERFGDGGPDSEFDFLIPVKPKPARRQ
ncbi:Right origin-binding protein [Lacunisphaera limnophila]|uniref:Right origin-binding protein n=1 Tax=Lacunisphaera limnophila TaxID=1838286 RepID=A0A1I7PHE0_9BACT|nr:helix-turn-helix domain-containing protein [Lacunisphaera limnophila]AOS43018.1 Right origin-binding protein [Lacunisphaera limnophila]